MPMNLFLLLLLITVHYCPHSATTQLRSQDLSTAAAAAAAAGEATKATQAVTPVAASQLTNPAQSIATAAASQALDSLVSNLKRPAHNYWFHPPNTVVEELPDGELNMDGGNFESAAEKDCALLARSNNGICPLPCVTTWPNGACIIKDSTDTVCICVDPCTAFDLSA